LAFGVETSERSLGCSEIPYIEEYLTDLIVLLREIRKRGFLGAIKDCTPFELRVAVIL
jgi:hypothetical protein